MPFRRNVAHVTNVKGIIGRKYGVRIMTSLSKQSSHLSPLSRNCENGEANTYRKSLTDIPKSSTFTSKLPPDPAFPTPISSHKAERARLGPRPVKGALYTYVRPIVPEEAELLAVSDAALCDIGLQSGVVDTEIFRDAVSGRRIITWEEKDDGNASDQRNTEANENGTNGTNGTNDTIEGREIYPWAQCYGGYQFGQWAGQLGDGRAISLFETTNPHTKARYEVQLKGAGRTPYSRFADGRAVLRSSIREFIVSEALHALGIPSTRALAITLTPRADVVRERIEPGAIVARFAQSWLRIGTFDLLRARADRPLLRQLATYVAEEVLGGWEALPGKFAKEGSVQRGVKPEEIQGLDKEAENRFARLYREIVRRNASTVAAWQAYGFMNGVLNTDNTSIMGLSMDFGPFAFMDDFDPTYTPNHDDYMLRYSYRNQPTIIWWNLVRLGEALGELIGAGPDVDDTSFITDGPSAENMKKMLVERAEHVILSTSQEYKAIFAKEYKRLMTARLGLKAQRDEDINGLLSDWLDILETYALDFNHSFRRLANIRLTDVKTEEDRLSVAGRFFHREGIAGPGAAGSKEKKERTARERIASWLGSWRARVIEDWSIKSQAQGVAEENGEEGGGGSREVDASQQEIDDGRMEAMRKVNPKFVPRSWILDEVIQRVEKKGEREILKRVLDMSLRPFEESWDWDEREEERLCGDVPKNSRAMQCSCSS